MKKCCNCKQFKDLSEFNKKSDRKDGHQGKCRECSNRLSKQHYLNDTKYYKEKAKKYQNRIHELINNKKSGPCKDCGNHFPPCAMQFDHMDPTNKIGSVSRRQNWSLERIEKEIIKCELVCACCHAVRTQNRKFNKKSSKKFK